MKFFISLTIILTFFTGCLHNNKIHNKPIKIAVSSWVGYAPLLYAYKKSMLEDINVEIVPTSSLSKSLELIKKDEVDGFCSTQRGYKVVKENIDVTPVVLFDKSFGGDKILSTLPKTKLYELKDASIDVYMEVESINHTVFEQFKQLNRFENITFNIKNHTQSDLAYMDIKGSSVVVTYEPFASILKSKGLYEIENSKNLNFFIVDGLFVKTGSFEKNKHLYTKLKSAVDVAIKSLKNNPEEFYDSVKVYLDGQSYEEFIHSIDGVRFINGNKKEILDFFVSQKIETKNIL